MFKKKYLAVAGLMALAVVISGCGKKNSGDSVVQATPTPTQETAVTATPTPELINMEETTEKNIMGEKTSTATNLVNGMFTLKNGENAVYYYEKGTSSATYDIRITYSDEDKNECFFRKLPLKTMKQITLRMDGSGDDAIPYATYMTASSTKEVSTLNDVKKRLGLSTDDSEDDSSVTPTDSDKSDSNNSSDSDGNNASPTSTPSADNNSGSDGDNTDPTNSTIQTAERYIGMSIDDLESAVGSAQSSEYDEDDTTGTTGYYYYPDFTVSTSVDEAGNEIVTGIW